MEKRGQLLVEDAAQRFFKIAYPSAIYRAYIDYYFEIQHAAAAAPFYVNGLPAANTLITFNLNQQAWSSLREGSTTPVIHNRAQLLGHLSILHTGIYSGGMHTFFVKLKPGIAALLFKEQATAFANEQIDFAHLWKESALEVRIQEAATFAQRIAIFQESLLKRVSSGGYSFDKVARLHRMMRSFQSLQLKDERAIEQICKANWVTYASARRDFLQYVGFTPKYCQKISRLKNALIAYKKQGYHFYYEDYGYTDFSHFAKDAKQLTGRPPSLLA